MTNVLSAIEKLKNGGYNSALTALYGENFEAAKTRYLELFEGFLDEFGNLDNPVVISTPGRTEICGNHTDHNNGKVAAASVELDIIGIAARRADNNVIVHSAGFKRDEIDISDLSPRAEEADHSASLIRGILARFSQLGENIGGFVAYTHSLVLKGSGLSSSAAFEVELASMVNLLFCEGRYSVVELAKIGQYAENDYYGKPCGLLDELACAHGGFVCLDFEDSEHPIIEAMPLSVDRMGCRLCIINTGGSHSDLVADYASIPNEMHAVADFFGKKTLREVDKHDMFACIPEIREALGDRAVLRAMHYYAENSRVDSIKKAVRDGDAEGFFAIVRDSGRSSYMFNQNAYSPLNWREQGISIALALCGELLGERGAYRLQGGGFAGTVQAFVPVGMLGDLKKKIEGVFGEGSCVVLKIRNIGTTDIENIKEIR